MKKLALVLAILIMLATPTLAQASTFHYGSLGPAVKQFQLQHHLKVDGIAGPVTMRAVKTDSIISEAKAHIGLHYVWGGTSPITGFDCSGFVQYVFKQNGVSLPRVSNAQSKVGSGVSYKDLKPGDLVFFSFTNGSISHVGIYLGGNQYIGAETSGLRIVTINQYWISHYVTARRVY